MSAFREATDADRALLGPGVPAEDLDVALRLEDLGADHVCTVSGEGVLWCRSLPAGGTAWCECGRPVFVPPATCREYLGREEIHAVFDASDLRAA